MSWDAYRKLQDDKEVNQEVRDWEWEDKNVPLLHDGFMTQTGGKKPRSRICLTITYYKGHYNVKIADRSAHLATWIEVETLERLLETCEAVLKSGETYWEPEHWTSNGP